MAAPRGSALPSLPSVGVPCFRSFLHPAPERSCQNLSQIGFLHTEFQFYSLKRVVGMNVHLIPVKCTLQSGSFMLCIFRHNSHKKHASSLFSKPRRAPLGGRIKAQVAAGGGASTSLSRQAPQERPQEAAPEAALASCPLCL